MPAAAAPAAGGFSWTKPVASEEGAKAETSDKNDDEAKEPAESPALEPQKEDQAKNGIAAGSKDGEKKEESPAKRAALPAFLGIGSSGGLGSGAAPAFTFSSVAPGSTTSAFGTGTGFGSGGTAGSLGSSKFNFGTTGKTVGFGGVSSGECAKKDGEGQAANAKVVCIVNLTTGTKFSADLESLKAMSGSIRMMVEGEDELAEVPVGGVTDRQLETVLGFIRAPGRDTSFIPDRFIPDLASAANILDIPELMRVIVTSVATKISKNTADVRRTLGSRGLFPRWVRRSGTFWLPSQVKPSGKFCLFSESSPWICSSWTDTGQGLAFIVSKLHDIQPELVGDQLTTHLLEQEADFAGLYNHLVARQLMGPTEASDYVARQYNEQARKEGVPTLAESNRRARSSLYTPAAAAASWDAGEKRSIPRADPSMGDAIGKVLKQVHPDTKITMECKMVVDDLLAYTLDAVAKVAGQNSRGVTTRLSQVPTGRYLDLEYAKADCNAVTVLHTRTVPSDQVLLTRLSEGESAGEVWWESRGEVVRVGLGGAVAHHEAKDPSERRNTLLDHLRQAEEQPDEVTARDIEMAIRQVFPSELAKHAVSKATKALTKYRDAGVALPRFDAACGGLEYGGKTAGEIGESIDSAAGLQFPALGVAHMMSACAGKPPSACAAVYMSAALEYICAEILELAGNRCRDDRFNGSVPCAPFSILDFDGDMFRDENDLERAAAQANINPRFPIDKLLDYDPTCSLYHGIEPRHLHVAIRQDWPLAKMYRQCSILDGGVLENIHSVHLPPSEWALDERLVSLDPARVAAAFGFKDSNYVNDRFVCGTRVDGTDREAANIPSFAKELQADLMSAGAVLAAQDNKEAGGTQDVLPSLMTKEAHSGQKGADGGGKAKLSVILRDAIQGSLGLEWERHERRPSGRKLSNPALATALSSQTEFTLEEWKAFGITDLRNDSFIQSGDVYFKPPEGITEHHCLAMAARAGVLQVNTDCFEEMRYIMKTWLKIVIADTVAIAQHGGRTTILDSDVLSAAIARLGRAETAEPKILCGTGRLAAVYAVQGAGRWAGAYPAADGSLSYPSPPFAQLAADFSSEVTRRVANQLYNNLPDADAAGGTAVEEEEEEEEEEVDCFFEIDADYEDNGLLARNSSADWSPGDSGCDHLDRRARVFGSGCHPSGVPFKTQDEIRGELAKAANKYAMPHDKGRLPWPDSLKYIRRMQKHTGRVLPFQPFVRLATEIAHDFASGVTFCLSAVKVLCAMLEDYMDQLLQQAQLCAISRGRGGGHWGSSKTFPFCGYDKESDPDGEHPSLAIYPRDLQLARRIRGEGYAT